MEVDAAGGRPQREKKPTEKVKPATSKTSKDDKEHVVPPKYVMPPNEPKFAQKPEEVQKVYNHTKTSRPTGEQLRFYKLGTHIESRDKHHYTRAQRDETTGYFHQAEGPPYRARLSDEDHPLCAAEANDQCFTQDMLGYTNQNGHITARANVFAREGSYYFETKLFSISQEGMESRDEALITTEKKKGLTKQDTTRGSVRIGFVRREHPAHQSVGVSGYSYGITTFGKMIEEYGNAQYLTEIFKVTPNNPGKLMEGDVVGLLITLPPLHIHQKVVQGTFNQSIDAPNLKCGPYQPKKAISKSGAKKSKTKPTQLSDDTLNSLLTPPEADIIRDRIPFESKKLIYFEAPEYARSRDVETLGSGKGKSINPDTGKNYNIREESHPGHELPHLRTLPGSKIEMFVNGEYQGTAHEHLLAFLPPASYIDKTSKTQAVSGALDDGLLGYYPAVTCYGGGAALTRFDEPFWFPLRDRPEARPFGVLYNHQVVDDFVSDLIDESCWEKTEELFPTNAAGNGAAVLAAAEAVKVE